MRKNLKIKKKGYSTMSALKDQNRLEFGAHGIDTTTPSQINPGPGRKKRVSTMETTSKGGVSKWKRKTKKVKGKKFYKYIGTNKDGTKFESRWSTNEREVRGAPSRMHRQAKAKLK
jgi:di/tripeptidase